MPILAVAGTVVAVAVLAFVAPRLLPPPPGGGAVDLSDTALAIPEGAAPAVDSGARIEIELLRGELEAFRAQIAQQNERIDSLQAELAAARSAAASAVVTDGPVAGATRTGPNDIIDQYAQVVLVASRRELNEGLSVPTSSWLVQTLGLPRENLNNRDCQNDMTNPRLAALLVTDQAGPITVTMLRPALESLRRVFANIEAADPDLYARINTAGSLCVRLVRGSQTSVSSHSFGLSVDLNIDGQLDTLGDGRTQLGLVILADFFNAEGWIWGAAFGREDSMHFEVARETVERWIAEGLL